jgi:hydroxymethylpyrimidine pyrophosphatase-like HAD family hydrolase
MPAPRLIAIDMDGTLLNSSGGISARNAAALHLAEEAGAEVVIATGRRHAYAMRVMRSFDLRAESALISSNGTVIRTIRNELLHRTHLPLETALWLCEHLEDFRNTLVATFDAVDAVGEEQRGALVCEQLDDLHASIDAWMHSNAPYLAHVPRLEDALHAGETPPIQMMVCGGIERMSAAEARLLEDPRVTAVGAAERSGAEIALHRTIYPERDLSIVDILPAGCSKASALKHLAELRGITTQEILAIGDNWNDAPMLRLAGRAALMSNAPKDLQELARASGWHIAPSNDEDGVAATIENAFALSAANA